MSGPPASAAATGEDVRDTPIPSRTHGVEISGLRKAYGDTIALDGLDLQARPGEILGVAGPNGAGKSTMIKVLAAETAPDAGSIRVDGEPWSVDIGVHRIAVVHQEPQLFPNLSVAENVMIGREHTRFLRRRLNEAEVEIMRELGIHDFRDRLLGMVSLAVQQRTEIARALVQDARVFLFDEPNSALTDEESSDLFRRMEGLAADGRVVILVSHRLAELVEHASRVAVIRDGVCTGVLEGTELTQDAIAAELVVGHAAGADGKATSSVDDHERPAILRLQGWTSQRGRFADIDLSIHDGEIVALLGVEGSGARELVRSMAGFEPGSGTLEVKTPDTTRAAADASHEASISTRGSAFVSADRQHSLFDNLDIGDNMVSRLGLEITSRLGVLRRRRMQDIAVELRDTFAVKTPSVDLSIRSLSGGNQQKVAIAAAIVKRPEVLVLEEPTRGVDIGSKAEIYRLMREYAQSGHAVAIYCTEVPEVFEVADFAYVVSDGSLSDAIPVSDHVDVESLARAITRLERHAWERREAARIATPLA
jgi:ABC-type sugar transport system ATPase subunit